MCLKDNSVQISVLEAATILQQRGVSMAESVDVHRERLLIRLEIFYTQQEHIPIHIYFAGNPQATAVLGRVVLPHHT